MNILFSIVVDVLNVLKYIDICVAFFLWIYCGIQKCIHSHHFDRQYISDISLNNICTGYCSLLHDFGVLVAGIFSCAYATFSGETTRSRASWLPIKWPLVTFSYFSYSPLLIPIYVCLRVTELVVAVPLDVIMKSLSGMLLVSRQVNA